ncbi:MAG: NYN domain-containing protein [Selenomonadaceae bacterium]|nr:NYN domain-containing protein [Selenomonadaceae bacterium]
MDETKKIALFIDAENISARFGNLIMDNLEKRGEVFIRRIYGNWEKPALRKWNDCILHYGLRTVHQIDFSSGKNATDMSLIVDVMDVFHKNQADIFAIVSNDSDYTPLAVRLREYGVYLIGIGRKDSSVSFKSACSEFISLDSLSTEAEEDNSFQVQAEIKTADTETETLSENKKSESDIKIAAIERKIAELEKRFEDPHWSVGFRLTAEENKNSAMPISSGKVKQNIKFASPVEVELSSEVEISSEVGMSIQIISVTENLLPAESSPVAEISLPLETVAPAENLLPDISELHAEEITMPVEVNPVEVAPVLDKNISVEPVSEMPAQIEEPFEPAENLFTPLENISTPAEISSPVENISTPVKVSTPKVSEPAENVSTPAEISTSEKVAAAESQASASKAERDKLMQQRLINCGKNGMRKPKKKLQQIHDVLHETAKLHGDKNGFVPLTFAGQDLKKKNLGFGVKDFGYALLNEFIGDFPELYELTHSKPRSFRYRCI